MENSDHPQWTADKLLELGRSYQAAAVFAAGADLDVFTALAGGPLSAADTARRLGCDLRGTTILLDALAALKLLAKREERYSLPPGIAPLLTSGSPESVLSMSQHQANCLRRWVQLARVVKTGQPAERAPSVRGEEGDEEAFIGAMHDVSVRVADEVVRAVQPLDFQNLLDVGGASGTWTAAFLRACPSGRATLFDLPEVIPLAERRLAAEGLVDRVRLAAGDYLVDVLPAGGDLAWVSAIVHQNSRDQNRSLFANVFQALNPGGRIAVRDILMEADRIHPPAGALFAVNMLTATEGGGTYTFEEVREDLQSVGFTRAAVTRHDEGMNSVVVALKPAAA